MTSPGARKLHVFTARMPADEYFVVRNYANLTSQSVNRVIVAAITRFVRQELGESEFDAMVADVRRKLRDTLEQLDDR